jgi:putative transposase
LSHKDRVSLIQPRHANIGIARQTELLDISRSSVYYVPRVPETDVATMNAIDKIYTKHPFYGSRRMRDELQESYGISCCRERVQRLMRIMGLEAVYPKKSFKTSISDDSHQKYPYLLKDVIICCPNHVWGTDITYVKLEHGFCYLYAIIDWYSRYVLAWEVSETIDTAFCSEALNRALTMAIPDIHNSDQGSQFTSNEYTDILKFHEIHISMDGRGRCFDNIFTERLWRTVKYEDMYLKSYQTMRELRAGLTKYFEFYNTKRRHQSLNRQTPEQVYFNHQNQSVHNHKVEHTPTQKPGFVARSYPQITV